MRAIRRVASAMVAAIATNMGPIMGGTKDCPTSILMTASTTPAAMPMVNVPMADVRVMLMQWTKRASGWQIA